MVRPKGLTVVFLPKSRLPVGRVLEPNWKQYANRREDPDLIVTTGWGRRTQEHIRGRIEADILGILTESRESDQIIKNKRELLVSLPPAMPDERGAHG